MDEWIGEAMKVDKEIFESWSELALQDLLINVAAIVAATELDRARNGNDAEWTQSDVSRKFTPEWLTQ
jgi:hypothetical protein